MNHFLEQLIASLWNRLRGQGRGAWSEQGSLDLGYRVADGEVTKRHLTLSNTRRTTHLVCVGKSGSGKSTFLHRIAETDLTEGAGFLFFDLHGDSTPFLLRAISARERKLRRHLSDKLILLDLTDPLVSLGLNPLEMDSPDFVRIAEFAEILKRRWSLDYFGARTDELLRNSLYALAANHLTLVELTPFLTNGAFRTICLKNIPNAEIRQYFAGRYDQASEPMRATMREPILNKTSTFTSDPRFRHLVGQAHSTFSFREAMDRGQWVLVHLPKGQLGEQAATAASLIFTVAKNAIFARSERSLFTMFCDEVQNLVAYGSGIETLFSEARKFGVGIISANQFLDQYSAEVRAALFSTGTQAFFQLSSQDATTVAQALDGGKPLAERLKNLPQRHFIVKSGSDRWQEVRVPSVHDPRVDTTDLVNRVRYTRGKVRAHIDREIAARQEKFLKRTDEVLHDWE